MVVVKSRKTITLVIIMFLLLSSCQKQEIKNDERVATSNETAKVGIDEKEKADIDETVKIFLRKNTTRRKKIQTKLD